MENYFKKNNLKRLDSGEVEKFVQKASRENKLNKGDFNGKENIYIEKEGSPKDYDIKNSELGIIYDVNNLDKEGQIKELDRLESEIRKLEKKIGKAEDKAFNDFDEINQYAKYEELVKLENILAKKIEEKQNLIKGN